MHFAVNKLVTNLTNMSPYGIAESRVAIVRSRNAPVHFSWTPLAPHFAGGLAHAPLLELLQRKPHLRRGTNEGIRFACTMLLITLRTRTLKDNAVYTRVGAMQD